MLMAASDSMSAVAILHGQHISSIAAMLHSRAMFDSKRAAVKVILTTMILSAAYVENLAAACVAVLMGWRRGRMPKCQCVCVQV